MFVQLPPLPRRTRLFPPPALAIDLDPTDWRRHNPRFQGANFSTDLELVKAVENLASAKGCTPAQLALARVLTQGEDIVPIPGTKLRKYLEQNARAADAALPPLDLAALNDASRPTRRPVRVNRKNV